MKTRLISLFFLFLAAAMFFSCTGTDGRSLPTNLSGRYLLTMAVGKLGDVNCAWNLPSGEMVVDQDGEDIVIAVKGFIPSTRGTANPTFGTFTVAYENDSGGRTTMDGTWANYDLLIGEFHATRPDISQSDPFTPKKDGCWLDASWEATRF